jgi:hypothetical protein
MKSKREGEGKRNHHLFNGAEIDKVLKSQNMSDAEKYSILRIKTD